MNLPGKADGKQGSLNCKFLIYNNLNVNETDFPNPLLVPIRANVTKWKKNRFYFLQLRAERGVVVPGAALG